MIAELREFLLHKAQWKWKFQKEPHSGFKSATVNQTLWVLRVLLDIAVEKLVLIENPFAVSSTLRRGLFAKGRGQGGKGGMKLQLPDRADMLRIFGEMRRVPEGAEGFGPNPEQRVYLEAMATEMADHAELLAYSGMRKVEATKSTVGDDYGDEFKIWGTKSESSERTIPVNPALRAVLDRIKSRRVGPKTKLVIAAEPRPRCAVPARAWACRCCAIMTCAITSRPCASPAAWTSRRFPGGWATPTAALSR